MSLTITPYNPYWPAHFSLIKKVLQTHLQDLEDISIEHIGSTSVPGLAAQPIIDILIIAPCTNFKRISNALLLNTPYDIRNDREAITGVTLKSLHKTPPHIIFLCEPASLPARAHLAIRNTLRKDAALRTEYATLKQQTNIEPYTYTKLLQRILIASAQFTIPNLTILFASTGASRWEPITTPRLLLREYQLADEEGMFALESEEVNARYQDWMPWTRKEARENVVRGVWRSLIDGRRIIELAVLCEGRFVGRVGGRITSCSCASDADTEAECKVGSKGVGSGAGQTNEDNGEEQINEEKEVYKGEEEKEAQKGISKARENHERDERKCAGVSKHIDLWYSFHPSHHGKGLATEAMQAFISALTTRYSPGSPTQHSYSILAYQPSKESSQEEREEEREKERVKLEFEIECDPRNTASWKLAERLGFTQFSLTERAWESKGEWVGSLVYRRVV